MQIEQPTSEFSLWIAMALAAAGLALLVPGCTSPAYAEGDDSAKLERMYGQGSDVVESKTPNDDRLRVYWFWSTTSQCSKRAEPAIDELVDRFPDLEVFVVHSNVDESKQEARSVADERELAAPLYRDGGARIAMHFEARMTPEVVVVAGQEVVYQGRPVSFDGDDIDRSYVAEAVESARAGHDPDESYRRPSGCVIRTP